MKRMTRIVVALVLLVCTVLPVAAFASENPVPKAKQAVVSVASGIYYENGEMETYDPRGYYSGGTAFGVYAEGNGALVFATNAHVVCNDKNKPYEHVYICVDGSTEYDRSTVVECDILYVDTHIDVAIIQAEFPISGVATLPLMRAEELETGDKVYAMGYPSISDKTADENNYTAEDITVTDGIISRYMTSGGVKCMAHTATVNHGNSGGPLINEHGHAIGINTFIYADNSTSDLRCYAIYSDYVMEAMDKLEIPYVLVTTQDTAQQPTQGPARETEPQTDDSGKGGVQKQSSVSMEVVLIIAGAALICIILVVLIVRALRNTPGSRRVSSTAQVSAVTVYAISGPLQGASWPLGQGMTVGRDFQNTVVYPPDTKGVSRVHCRIEQQNGQILVTDLGSSCGTFVGGRKLTPNMPVSVSPNTEIWLGGDKIRMLLR